MIISYTQEHLLEVVLYAEDKVSGAGVDAEAGNLGAVVIGSAVTHLAAEGLISCRAETGGEFEVIGEFDGNSGTSDEFEEGRLGRGLGTGVNVGSS